MVEARELAQHDSTVLEVVQVEALITERADLIFQQDIDKRIMRRSHAGHPVQRLEDVQLHILELALAVLVATEALQSA